MCLRLKGDTEGDTSISNPKLILFVAMGLQY